MTKGKEFKLLLLVLIPFIFDFIYIRTIDNYIGKFGVLYPIRDFLIFWWEFIFIIFLFNLARKITQKGRKFIICALFLWTIVFSLYISQYFRLSFLQFSNGIIHLFNNTNIRILTAIISYIIILLIFISGFIYQQIKNKKSLN